MNRIMRPTLCLLAFWLLAPQTASAQLDTTITYQGSLSDNGSHADGPYDFEFELWNQSSGGLQFGLTQTLNDVLVDQGIFTVTLDFGVYEGSDLWMEIHLRDGGSGGGYTSLTPRTQLTIAPQASYADYAALAGNAGAWSDSGSDIYYNDGKVGIGTTTPQYPLHIQDATPYLQLDDTDGGTSWLLGLQSPTVGFNIQEIGGGTRFVITEGGNVGIGTTTPINARLHVVGLAEEIGIKGEGDWGVVGIGGTGGAGLYGEGQIGGWGMGSVYDFTAVGAGIDYHSASSRRWKSDIRNIDKPLDKISRLRGVYYTWDQEHGGRHDVGMVAEDVGEVLPEIVGYEKNGVDATGMDYSKLTPLLVEAVNALRAEKNAEILELIQRIDLLEQQHAE